MTLIESGLAAAADKVTLPHILNLANLCLCPLNLIPREGLNAVGASQLKYSHDPCDC